MVRGFSEEEKVIIKDQLQNEFMKDLRHQNIQQIRIDDLVKRVGIAKGSFYLFYSSKEMLFADVAKKVQSDMVTDIMKLVKEHPELEKKEQLKLMLKQLFHYLTEYFPWLGKLESVEFEKSLRKLPEETRNSLFRDDVSDIQFVLTQMKMKTTIPIEEVASMIQIITFSSTRHDYFNTSYQAAVDKMLEMLVEQFVEEE
ncbi:TetR/AcrR family transcriptional regulator [Isobaculum melis]|uniref:DNA-binding transcriptional regulator, AcrR family n=1 Tax=Isobaculum melis TaxID=142588 RepID=A0A1H9Q5U7_9LACT|nr:TetR/AcrR family transcriptional regulator [Isobaculum melis]SER55782.1 DNA-binding transcriptional regulator, AcrR family [Isobaculum melis]